MSTFIARTAVADSPKRSRLAIAIVSALALVMALLTPAMPASAAGSGSITAVSPTTGPTGQSVVITGTDFTGITGAGSVKFGALNATFTVDSDTQITAVAPGTGTGTVDITVAKSSSWTVVISSAFTYRTVTPVVSSVSPSNGSATGYNTVTISGSNFTGTTNVKFGTVAAISFSVLSDSRITAVVPAGTSGAAVRVTVEGRGNSTNAVNYTYKSSTCVAGTYLTTKFGYLSSTLTKKQKRAIRETADEFVTLGCEQVNLVKYIGKRAGASAAYKAYLTLQNKRANAVLTVLEKRLAVWSVPVVVDVVKRANQKSQAKKASPDLLVKYRNVLLRVPAFTGIESLYPNVGSTTGTTALGNTVVITGKGFTNLADTGAVRFGSTASPNYVVNTTGTVITAQVPAGLAGNVNITVQTGVAGTSTAKLYSRQFTYVAAPTVTSLNVTSGSIVGGNSVNITGTGFVNVSAVRFDGARAISYVVNSATSITAVAPAGSAGAKNITVVAGGGTSSGFTYTYKTAPTVASATPASGVPAGGTSVVIAGTGFSGVSGASSVKFGNNNATSYAVNSDTQITAFSPAGTAASVAISVVNPFGSAQLAGAYLYGPSITNLAPSSGPVAGGTLVTITGTGFTGATAVKFGANNAASFNVVSDTSITATTAAGSAGQVNVTVVNGGVTSVSTATFSFLPTVASLDVTSGTTAGGTTVVITGTGFTGATAVKFGATNATGFTVVSATQISAISPAGSAGAVTVTVTNGGVTSTNAVTYTYVTP